jgi:hypothetical protein
MSAMSDHLENEILDHILSVGSYTMPSAVYLGLSVASMGDDASGTELSGSGYARQAVTFSAASGGTTSNSAAITFPTATGSWGSIGYWSLWDASSSGNMLLHGAFSSAKTIASGDVLRVSAGDLDITAA